jgi:hypothetical protein
MDKALVGAYWFQVVGGQENFTSYPVNWQLKLIGHPLTHISRAMESAMETKPKMVIQIKKRGNSPQAKKEYRLTPEGIKYVKAMFAKAQ